MDGGRGLLQCGIASGGDTPSYGVGPPNKGIWNTPTPPSNEECGQKEGAVREHVRVRKRGATVEGALDDAHG